MSPGGAGSESHNNKSSLLLSFKKEESSFLKKRSKRLLFLCANLTVRFRSEAFFQVVSLISRGEQLHLHKDGSVALASLRGRLAEAIQETRGKRLPHDPGSPRRKEAARDDGQRRVKLSAGWYNNKNGR